MTAGTDLGKFLYCSSVLERMVAEAYEHIAQLIGDKVIEGLLKYVARDSFKHAECFRLMAELFSHGIDICTEDCVKVWGESWLATIKEAEKICKKSDIGPTDLKSLISGLERIEGLAAEEYLTILHAKLIGFMTEDENVNFGLLRTVLNWIVEDEERHKRIIEIIRDLLSKHSDAARHI